MYHLDVFDKYHVNITWYDVYFGLKKGFLNLDDVQTYALRCLELEDSCCEEISSLAWENDDKQLVLEYIEKVMKTKNVNDVDEQAVIKWQYCIIKNLTDNLLEFREISSTLDELYADFDYPKDMEEFVSYMPIKDGYNPTEHSKEENIKRILYKVEGYLDEKQKIVKPY